MASVCGSSLFAQDAVLGQKYGLGVHAYFAGDYTKAYEELTAAIEGGSKDPRAFYFRGLTYLKLGRPQDANLDFQKGADLESRDFNKFYNVAKSLERVQGESRLALEKFRVNARMAAIEEAERMRKARYEAIQREEQRVLREQSLVPPPMPEAAKPGATDQPAADVDVFATPAEKPAADAGKKPAKAAKSAKKAGETPAAEAGEKPSAEAPAEEKKPAAEEKKPDEKKASPEDPFAS